jgi:hypothetical protein
MDFIELNSENINNIRLYVGRFVVFRNDNNNPQVETIIGYSITEKRISIKITNTRYPASTRLDILKISKRTGAWKIIRNVYVIIAK